MVGANCEQEPARRLPILRSMREADSKGIAGQPAAFRTTDATPCFTRLRNSPTNLRPSRFHERSSRGWRAGRALKASVTWANVAVAALPTIGRWNKRWHRINFELGANLNREGNVPVTFEPSGFNIFGHSSVVRGALGPMSYVAIP